MKQRITVDQLNKLTDDQKQRLVEWFMSTKDYTLIPLLNIGQMIEFINEKKPLKSIAKSRFDKWKVNNETVTLGYKDELCDSLWETVTRII